MNDTFINITPLIIKNIRFIAIKKTNVQKMQDVFLEIMAEINHISMILSLNQLLIGIQNEKTYEI